MSNIHIFSLKNQTNRGYLGIAAIKNIGIVACRPEVDEESLKYNFGVTSDFNHNQYSTFVGSKFDVKYHGIVNRADIASWLNANNCNYFNKDIKVGSILVSKV